MTKKEFEQRLDLIANKLGDEARATPFATSKQFENRVREIAGEILADLGIEIDFNPHPQAFPDIAVGEFGIEVKFTTNDDWRSVANSVLETNRIESVKTVYIMFGKVGGMPEVKWGEYEKCVMHVRTSHVPRFEVQIGAPKSLFEQMGVSYDDFRVLEMHEKMRYIREYARGRLKDGERLWWLEDAPGEEHSFPIEVKLYTELDEPEKIRLRAEAILLCPQIASPSRTPHKYDDVALFMLTYHGVLCHQTRDMFSAGSVANPKNDDSGGLYIARALKLMEEELIKAAMRMDSALFEEYWGIAVAPEKRIAEWLRRADGFARGTWKPSEYLFQEN
jgi:hypothetical protein